MNASASIHISRTPSDVFAYVMEVSDDAHWRAGVVEAAFTTDPPLGVGTKLGYGLGNRPTATFRPVGRAPALLQLRGPVVSLRRRLPCHRL